MLNFLLEGEATTTGGGFNFSWIIIIVGLFAAMYFLMIRPEKKREKAAQEMRNTLAVGDEVTTIGGIIGKVVSIKDETFVLETTRDRTRIRFLLTAIRTVDVKAAESTPVRARATAAPKKGEAAVAEDVVEEAVVEEAATEEVMTEETATESTDTEDKS